MMTLGEGRDSCCVVRNLQLLIPPF